MENIGKRFSTNMVSDYTFINSFCMQRRDVYHEYCDDYTVTGKDVLTITKSDDPGLSGVTPIKLNRI